MHPAPEFHAPHPIHPATVTAAAIERFLAQTVPASDPATMLSAMLDAGLDRLPMPGQGGTLARWRALAVVAAHDLALLKLYEGHTDALAIVDEIGGPQFAAPAGARWGVWCAEAPGARLELRPAVDDGGDPVLSGRKAWCSGAAGLTHALVSCWNEHGQACLAAVALDQPGVHITNEGWQAVGMAASASVDVDFEHAAARQIGTPGAYLQRPGFWHGGAGIAACWLGAAGAVGAYLAASLHRAGAGADPHRLAQLGAIDITLAATTALLRDAAAAIDRHPERDARALALRTRLSAEAAATQVLALATRALGAGPLCRDARFARLCADLPVFLRQSHAERDLAALGMLVAQFAQSSENPWKL
jgi:alkylation response protein AidB-like acyl-CoA dehydrogenase